MMLQQQKQRDNASSLASAKMIALRAARPSLTIIFTLACLLFVFATSAYASTISGSVDSTNKYAWGNVAGYINFAPTNGGLTITDSGITGYAWSSNTGWINFDTAQSSVTNDGEGTLGGYAWDEGAGWVSFTGVTIDSSGQFNGMATGGTVRGASYAINFDCATCTVTTDWRPASSRPSTAPAGGGGSAILPRTTTTKTITTVTTVSQTPAFPQEKGTVKKNAPQPTEPGISGGNAGTVSSSVGNYIGNAVSSFVTQAKNMFLNLTHTVWSAVLSVGHFFATAWHNFLIGLRSLWNIASKW
jgi:hypothetical protein